MANPLCTSEIQIWQIEKSLRSYERLELSGNLMVSKIQRQSVGHDWRMIYATFATMEGCLLAASMKLSKRERMYRIADKATGCEIWDRLRSAKWFRKWWEYKINPFCCRRTIVGALIVEWKFYSLHFDNTWLRINKW